MSKAIMSDFPNCSALEIPTYVGPNEVSIGID